MQNFEKGHQKIGTKSLERLHELNQIWPVGSGSERVGTHESGEYIKDDTETTLVVL